VSRIIVFGGTFDPVHVGHLALAEFAKEETGAACVLLIPAGQNPLREAPGATFDQRLAMLRLATADQDIVVDPREGARPGPSYTVDTLEELHAELARPLWLLLGGDQLAGFRHWRRWERILELAELLVVNRPGCPAPTDAVPHRSLEWPGMELSASWLRARLAAGHRCRHLLPCGVGEYIEEEGLYR
jgi:nicotinate-nucleotide adenylyltransferase